MSSVSAECETEDRRFLSMFGVAWGLIPDCDIRSEATLLIIYYFISLFFYTEFTDFLCCFYVFFLVLLYVQEVVTHLYSNLLYKMGHYFFDTQYGTQYSLLVVCSCFSPPLKQFSPL